MTAKKKVAKKVEKKATPKVVRKPQGYGFPFNVKVTVTNLVKGEQTVSVRRGFVATDNVKDALNEVVADVLKA